MTILGPWHTKCNPPTEKYKSSWRSSPGGTRQIRIEEAIMKKDKQMEGRDEEIVDLKKIRDAIFNLSKSTAGGAC